MKIVTREEYYNNHVVCPKCKTRESVRATNIFLVRSEARDFVDKLNSAICDGCGWKGQVCDLLKP